MKKIFLACVVFLFSTIAFSQDIPYGYDAYGEKHFIIKNNTNSSHIYTIELVSAENTATGQTFKLKPMDTFVTIVKVPSKEEAKVEINPYYGINGDAPLRDNNAQVASLSVYMDYSDKEHKLLDFPELSNPMREKINTNKTVEIEHNLLGQGYYSIDISKYKNKI